MFDIESFLNSHNIHIHRAGEKNVSKGWININCPFCRDSSWHLGVNLESLKFNCYSCGNKGTIEKLIHKISGCRWNNIPLIVSQFDSFAISGVTPEITINPITSIQLPLLDNKWRSSYLKYLENRGFDAKKTISEYELMPTGIIGKYSFRILIPIFNNYKLVSFTTRDITNQSKIRYLDLSPEKSIIPVKKNLYNIDKAGNNVVIVEGATDVWRIGSGAIATMTTQFNNEQLYKIISRNFKKVFVMFDGEEKAIKRAYNLANKLSCFYKDIEVIELADGDPAEMNEEDVKYLRKELKL